MNPKSSILVFLGFVLISIVTLSVFTSNKVYADEPDSPIAVTVDPSGNVFVIVRIFGEPDNDRVIKYTNTGKFIKKWGIGDPEHALDVAVDPSNGNVFVPTELNTIQKYNNDGKFIREWKKHDFVKDELFGLGRIAVDKSGNVFVVAAGSKNQIQKYSNTGKFIRQWGSEVSGDDQIAGAGGVATDPSGNVFSTDFDSNRIQKFSNTGKFIRNWITSTEANSPLPLSLSLP